MNTGKVAGAVTGGYLLGRFHKARWALTLAGAVAGRQLRANSKDGASDALKSTQMGKLAQTVRGQLGEAGKALAVAAAARRMDALSDRLAERTEALRGGSGSSSDADAEDAEAQEDGDEQEEDAEAQEDGDEQEQKPERGGAKRASAKTAEPSRKPKSSGGTPKKSSTAKSHPGGAARKKSPGTRSAGGGAAKKTGSRSGTSSRTARKSTASGRAGGRDKG
jgi:hypothetical protein